MHKNTLSYVMNPKKTNESKEFWISNADNFWSMHESYEKIENMKRNEIMNNLMVEIYGLVEYSTSLEYVRLFTKYNTWMLDLR